MVKKINPDKPEMKTLERDHDQGSEAKPLLFADLKAQVHAALDALRDVHRRTQLSASRLQDPESTRKLVGFLKQRRELLETAQTSGPDGYTADWLMGENSHEINLLIADMTRVIDRYERDQAAQTLAAETQTAADISAVRQKIEGTPSTETEREKIWRTVVQPKIEALMTGGPYTPPEASKQLGHLLQKVNDEFQAQRPGIVGANKHLPFGPSIPLMIQEKKWFGLRNNGPQRTARFQPMADEGLHNFSVRAVNETAEAVWGR